ncbi:hypothetical protein ACOME3_007510 [Neoechinorhynchus agilis]
MSTTTEHPSLPFSLSFGAMSSFGDLLILAASYFIEHISSAILKASFNSWMRNAHRNAIRKGFEIKNAKLKKLIANACKGTNRLRIVHLHGDSTNLNGVKKIPNAIEIRSELIPGDSVDIVLGTGAICALMFLRLWDNDAET